MGTTEDGDRYEFERSYPLNEPNQTTSRTEIIYKGTELFVYQDDRSTVVMRPHPATQRAEGDHFVKGEKPKADGDK